MSSILIGIISTICECCCSTVFKWETRRMCFVLFYS